MASKTNFDLSVDTRCRNGGVNNTGRLSNSVFKNKVDLDKEYALPYTTYMKSIHDNGETTKSDLINKKILK